MTVRLDTNVVSVRLRPSPDPAAESRVAERNGGGTALSITYCFGEMFGGGGVHRY